MKILCLCTLLILHCDDMYDFIAENLRWQPSGDSFLDTRFLEPLFRFIVKCCSSSEQYSAMKHSGSRRNRDSF